MQSQQLRRRLHFTYDQGEKAQNLAQLYRIMNPTWNNVNQHPNEFIKTFTLLIQHIRGDIRSHMLMNYNLTTADFDESCTKVEDCYRNVYIDNSGGQIAGLQKPKKPWPPWKKKQ
eukprot:5428683-Amphidinium_carterae.1